MRYELTLQDESLRLDVPDRLASDEPNAAVELRLGVLNGFENAVTLDVFFTMAIYN